MIPQHVAEYVWDKDQEQICGYWKKIAIEKSDPVNDLQLRRHFYQVAFSTARDTQCLPNNQLAPQQQR